MGNHRAGQSLTSTSPPSTDLARIALGDEWDSVKAASDYSLGQVRATAAELDRLRTVSLVQLETKLNGSLSATVKAHLSTIGAAMRPDLSEAQAKAWIDAMVVKLSDLPPNVLTKATSRALHLSFQFPSEVEPKLRELAEEHLARIAVALHRLRATERAIADALNPKPRLTDDWNKGRGSNALTTEAVHELQRKGDPFGILKLGKSLGYVSEDQLLPELDDPNQPPKEG